MTWHANNKSNDDVMRYVQDSPAWHHVDETFPSFAQEARNVRFGLAMDGINPYKQFRSKHSSWPVLLINYNIPPWLAMRKGHVYLSLIIPGIYGLLSIKCFFNLRIYILFMYYIYIYWGVFMYACLVCRTEGM